MRRGVILVVEMDFRLTKMRTVLKRVELAGETPNPNRPAAAADSSTSDILTAQHSYRA